MGLSKEDIELVEEPPTAEVTPTNKSKKRKLRRKKLNVAITANLNIENAVPKDTANSSVVLNTGCLENINEQSNQLSEKKLLCKDQNFLCQAEVLNKTHQDISKDSASNINKKKKTKSKEPDSTNTLLAASENQDLVINQKYTCLIPAKIQEGSSDNSLPIHNPYIKDKAGKCELGNPVSNKRKKKESIIINDTQESKSDKSVSTENQKANCQKSGVTQNQNTKSVPQDLTQNKKIKLANPILNQNQKNKCENPSDNLILSTNQKPKDKSTVLAQNQKAESQNSEPCNEHPKSKKSVSQNQEFKEENTSVTLNPIIKNDHSVLIQNQRSNVKKPHLTLNQNTKPDNTNSSKKEKKEFNNSNNIKIDNLYLSRSQKRKLKNSVSPERIRTNVEKRIVTLNQSILSDKFGLSNNENTNFDSPALIEKQNKKVDLLLNENKSVNSVTDVSIQIKKNAVDIPVLTENQKPKSNSLVPIENIKDIAEDQISILDEITISIVIKNHNTESEGDIKNQDPTPQIRDTVENQENETKTEMGKSKETQESEKPQKLQGNDLKADGMVSTDAVEKSRMEVKAAREAKKLLKQKTKKKNDATEDNIEDSKASFNVDMPASIIKVKNAPKIEKVVNKIEESVTLDDLKFKDHHQQSEKAKVTDRVNAKSITKPEGLTETDVTTEKVEESGKSKAELRAERRAKQEAQRAAKQVAAQAKVAPKPEFKEEPAKKEEKSPKPKAVEKPKSKTQSVQRMGWFQHLHVEKDKESLKNVPINSNLHPAVVKLGVQLASHVVTGANARCIALLDALKKMVRDYSLPARTEFARDLESQLTASVEFLSSMRQPTASETNALKHFRRQLTQLPNNVDEFDAKKKLQEEIDRYIREQIDMAGEAISITVRKKICNGDNILTYGCSSLIERILCEAWAAGVQFRATVVGSRSTRGAREMLRRLRARGLPACYADLAALAHVMADVHKVVLGAAALLANGGVLGAAGGAALALAARARNVPVLVACETHKFSERAHTDAFVYNEIGDPDDLIDKTDENSPLKDWRSNPNLTLLNLTYDVTPPSLITAVVTELGILPCTSAPVVLRFKLSEYGM